MLAAAPAHLAAVEMHGRQNGTIEREGRTNAMYRTVFHTTRRDTPRHTHLGLHVALCIPPDEHSAAVHVARVPLAAIQPAQCGGVVVAVS